MVSEEFVSVTLEPRPWFGFREDIPSVLRSAKVLPANHMPIDLLNHVVNTCEEMFAPFVVAGELLRQSDEALVVDIERSRLKLFEAEFFEYSAEIHDVFGDFHCRLGFCFG